MLLLVGVPSCDDAKSVSGATGGSESQKSLKFEVVKHRRVG